MSDAACSRRSGGRRKRRKNGGKKKRNGKKKSGDSRKPNKRGVACTARINKIFIASIQVLPYLHSTL
ncbi:MAG: hypothetical protein J7J20_00245 [Desulfurococcales archaeon]|nr:hypothetical protein [Desulfurococcales archaeon]